MRAFRSRRRRSCRLRQSRAVRGRLDGVGLDHAGIAEGELFEVVETLDIGFDNLAAGAGRAPEMASQTWTMGARSEVCSISSWWAPMGVADL